MDGRIDGLKDGLIENVRTMAMYTHRDSQQYLLVRYPQNSYISHLQQVYTYHYMDLSMPQNPLLQDTTYTLHCR